MTLEQRVESLENKMDNINKTACPEAVNITSIYKLNIGINSAPPSLNSRAILANQEIQ